MSAGTVAGGSLAAPTTAKFRLDMQSGTPGLDNFDQLARLVTATISDKPNTMAAQSPALPSPGIPIPALASPYQSPAISNPALPNGVTRSSSAGSMPGALSNAGSPVVQLLYAPQPPGHVSPPLLQHQGTPRPVQGQTGPGVNHTQQNHMAPGSYQTNASPQLSSTPVPSASRIPPPTGVLSPQRERSASSTPIQFSKEYTDLSDMIENTSPDIVRQVIRDQWDRALLGSQYHIAFILNATIHQADPETLTRAVQDFGERMVKLAKQHVVRHLDANDFDEVADLLLPKVSNQFLDKALARRFETIPARQLVNALARAERLGYDVQDIVEQTQGAEHVIPSMPPMPTPPGPPVPSHSLPSQSHLPPPPQAFQPPPPPAPGNRAFIHIDPNGKSRGGPNGSVFCGQCGWPCTAQEALNYHIKRAACGKVNDSDRIGREVCPHCGSRFGSSGGLAYHLRTMVCGGYTDEKANQMHSLIAAHREEMRQKRLNSAPLAPPPPPPPPSQASNATSKFATATPARSVTSDWVTPGNDPYAKLNPEQKDAFEKEMKDAAEYYGGLMKDALKLPEPEQSRQMSSLKNRYNTKQSVTRKKYGIRLRERRSKAQIAAERTMLFGTADGPSLSGRDGPRAKRARTSDAPSTAPINPGTSSQVESPRKRVTVAEMGGGLSGASATAELTDPTAFLTSSQPRHLQAQPPREAPQPALAAHGGSQDDPMAIDDDSDSDTDSDDDDIPASAAT